ncbi:MAG: purine-nucleoside phosphorylase [Marinilabiliales bacterium]|mgnify:FL=1|nr:MAG: purine-nucleoside phosphorylase [Marinilabiliales bacterium]
MLEKINSAVDYIFTRVDKKPKVGIILGSGLGNLSTEIKNPINIPYEQIPNFPVSTVKGHNGSLIFGELNGIDVVAMSGRFHFYEGYSMNEVTLPVRVFKKLGIEYLFVSNASGGVNNDFEIGDIMFITDHINLMPNPLIGANIEEFGPRFVDMSESYNKSLLGKAEKVAKLRGIKFQTGIYAGISGPTYETLAEYKYIKAIGADAVGMSTTPEVIVARHMGLQVFAVSVISDLGVEGKMVEISHDEVIDAAGAVAPKLTQIIKDLLLEL